MDAFSMFPLMLFGTLLAGVWPDLSEPLPMGEDHGADAALVLGIEHYGQLPDVPGAAATAQDWAAWFVGSAGLPAENVNLLVDAQANASGLTEGLIETTLEVGGGTLWVVFIGHGAWPTNGMDRSLLPADVRPDAASVDGLGLSFGALRDLLSMGAQARTVVVLDMSIGGLDRAGQPLVPDLSRLVPGFVPVVDDTILLLSATRGREPAALMANGQRPAFSTLALGGLRGWADGDGDGRVRAGELVVWAEQASALVGAARLTPRAWGDEGWVLSSARETSPDLVSLAWDDAQARIQERVVLLDAEEAATQAEASRAWLDRPRAGEASDDDVRTFLATFLMDFYPRHLVAGEQSRWLLVPEAEEALDAVRQAGRASDATGSAAPVAVQHAIQLTEEIRSRAQRNAWSGVDDAYRELETLAGEGVVLTLEQCVWGAQAARSLGDVAAVRERLLRALRARDGQWAQRVEVVDWLNEVESRYGPVSYRAAERAEASLEPRQMPFPPDQRAAVEWARQVMAAQGRLDGWLPGGLYAVGTDWLLVVPGEPARVLKPVSW